MFKKTMILAFAIMAIGAASAPLASANWTHNKVKLPAGTNPQIELTGQWTFASVIGNINCHMVILAQLTGGQTTGHVTKFEVLPAGTPTTQCVTGGPLATCKVKSAQATQLPWVIHSDGADKITITTGEIHYVLENSTGTGDCAFIKTITLKPAAAPHEFPTANIPAGLTSTVTEVHLQGKLTATTGTTLLPDGTLTVQPPNAGTYGTA